uniref:NADH-ubiquinone oxidoreductase chain 1 n=1 Tax=Tetrastichus howardi TaxID=2848231 RepID=A0A8F5J5E1_9HYME|nr:NADH dehydrogenase subunit 1 [Tetrastichus howardi]QXM14793.1 NADH dehydrogenase subunit 1 [Tetrastichus howardi]
MYLNMMLNSIIIFMDMMLMILISIAFLTLMERKVLGYIQLRKGPNKVGLMGIFQPFSDAMKLFTKETSLILKSNYLFYLISPLLSMMIMLMLWYNIPMFNNIMSLKMNLLMILCIMSMSVYMMMMAGWSSNSIYSLIGSMRSIAQTISYEVSMILIMLNLILLIESFNLIKFSDFQYYQWFMLMNFPIMLIFFVSFLAELNRTPFDFAEGESELVSGFNTEYMSGSFAMIFIAEYGMIMFMMYLFTMFFWGDFKSNYFIFIFMMMVYLTLWIRGTLPRFRYDNLMMLTWKIYLPISLSYLIIILCLKLIILI